MKKLLLTLPIFAGVAWAGTTVYSGSQTEHAYEKLLDQLNGTSLFSVESTGYEAGLTESTATTEVRFNDPSGSGKPEVIFSLKHEINHSPVSVVPESARFGAANIVTTLDVESIKDEEVRKNLEMFDTGEPFVLTTDVSMNGSTKSELKFNALEATSDEDDFTFTTESSVINIATSENGDISGEGALPAMTINDGEKTQGSLSETLLNFDLKKVGDIEGSLYDATVEINNASSTVVDPSSGAPIYVSKGTYMKFDQSLTADEPFGKFAMGVESIETALAPLKSYNIESEMTGFSSDAIITYQHLAKEFQALENPEEIFQNTEYLMALREIIPPDTRLTLVADAETTDGKMDANIDVRMVGNGSDDGYTGMITTGDLAKAFAATVDIKADKAALMATPAGEMLANPFAALYLTITEDLVSLNASLDKLELKLNGQVLPLELFAGEMLQLPLESLVPPSKP